MNSRLWHSKLTLREIKKAKRGIRFDSAGFCVRFATYRGSKSLFLLVASKKRIGKHAVLRNRAKRRLRAAIDTLDLRVSVCAMIVIYNAALSIKFETLVSQLKTQYLSFCSRLHTV